MRRVRNPYLSSEFSGSQKSQSSSMSHHPSHQARDRGGKRKIEIEKVGDDDGNEDLGISGSSRGW